MGALLNRRRVMGGGEPPNYLMTTATNPEVLAVCYAQGWCASANGMTYEEAAAVTSVGTAFRSASTNIKTFHEFEYFTGVTSLVTNAFGNATTLKEITLPSSLESVGSYAFENCNLDKFICKSQNLTTLGDAYTFRYAAIAYAYFDSPTITVSGNGIFPAKEIELGSNVRTFNARLSKIETFNANEGLTTLGSFNGYNNAGFVSLVVPSTVTSITDEGFRNCSYLTSLTMKNPNPITMSNYTFFSTNANLVIYVPAESVELYKTANVWKTKASSIQAIPT